MSHERAVELRRGDGIANVDDKGFQKPIGPWWVLLDLSKVVVVDGWEQTHLSAAGPLMQLQVGPWVNGMWNEFVEGLRTFAPPAREEKAQSCEAVPEQPEARLKVRVVVVGLCELKWMVPVADAADAYLLRLKLVGGRLLTTVSTWPTCMSFAGTYARQAWCQETPSRKPQCQAQMLQVGPRP